MQQKPREQVTVQGRVRGADGRWLQGARIGIKSRGASGSFASGYATTDASGRFSVTFDYFPPYHAVIHCVGYGRVVVPAQQTSGRQEPRTALNLHVNGKNDLGVVTLPVAHSRMTGQVVDEKGRGVRVRLYGLSPIESSNIPATVTRPDGRFQVESVLPKDRVTIALVRENRMCVWENVPTGRTNLRLVFTKKHSQRYPD